MKNILVVDDYEDMLDAIDILITTFGFNVTIATSYESLVKTFDEYIPDAILLDVVLGLEDGRHICELLKSDPKTSNVFIILISGKPEALLDFRKVQADAILDKPIEIKKFQDLIKKFDIIAKNRST